MKGVIVINCHRYLGGYFRAISNAMSQDIQQNSEQLGLTSTQGMFLHHIWFRTKKLGLPTHAKDLEVFFDIKHPTVSGVLQRMESAGFVEFQANESDRRCKAVCLTQKAMDAIEQIGRHIESTEQRLTAGMTEDEIIQFRQLLEKAAKNLNVCHKHPIQNQKKEESTT